MRTSSFGDKLPFLVIIASLVLSFPFPRVMGVVAFCWLLFTIGGLARTSWLLRNNPSGQMSLGQVLFLGCVFNVPTALVGFIVWWRCFS